MKAGTIFVALLGAVLVSGFGTVTEEKAKELATGRFSGFCSDFAYAPTMFIGPFKTKAAGAAFAYEWRSKDRNGLGRGLAGAYGIVVSVMPDGDTRTTLLDQPSR